MYCIVRTRRSLGTLCTLLLALAAHPAGADKAPLTLEAIFHSDTFHARLPASLRWQRDGKSFTYLGKDSSGAVVYHRAVGARAPEVLLRFAELRGLPEDFAVSDVDWHAGTGYALLRGPVKPSWDGYREASYYIWDPKQRAVWPLVAARKPLRMAELSPDGRSIGYVSGNNLYLMDLASRRSRAVTGDGGEHIFNGIFDYGSTEFGPRRAWHWSPDGRAIAFWRLDASAVPYYPMIDRLHSYPQVRRFHYPNTAETHARYRIGVYGLDSGKTRWLDTKHDPDDYLPHLTWLPDSSGLFVQRLTRTHQTLDVYHADLATGKLVRVLRESEPTWIDVTLDLTPIAERAFLWTSERTGWRHVYRCAVGEDCKPLTAGDWSVDDLLAVDTDGGWAYFYAKKDSLIDQHVYRVPLGGGEVERVTTKPGWHDWHFAPGARHALAIHSDARTPPTLALRGADGSLEAQLVAESVPALQEHRMSHTQFITFTTDDGIELNGFFIKPPDFDPTRRYPVIAYGYGNAGSQVVVNRWGTQRGPQQDLWHRYMAQEGYIIFAMDNRTTRGRGKAAKNLTYGEYGKYAVLDYLQAVDFLREKPWIDADRIGFWGWSGGGYLAAALMTKGAPHFAVGISVAPVIDLTRYQAVGVERWMGTPTENPEGYTAVNVMNDAQRLEGKLLLIHGTGDENVKFAFTLQFADALIRADRQFDMLVYPNQRHGISDHRGHVFATMTRYFKEHL